jgi:acyl-CoA reductase-like NAD-dependent aldehyde dehydrogenase
MPGVNYGVTQAPFGLVGVISPWNFPLLLALTDAVPALAAGCAALVKPSEVTPRFIGPLMRAVARVEGLPLALVEGDGATGAALVPLVDFVAFTGSVATGRKVAEAAARAFVPASLELGGKDPLIVLESADPKRAAAIALSASCRATGQACQSIERIYVARPLHDVFIAELVRHAEAVQLNWPDIGAGDLGPFIFARQAEQVAAQIGDAVARGARVLTGGTIETHGGGLWLRPTVLADVTHAMDVMREETFGPVLPVMPFDTVDEALRLANDSVYGLSAAVVAATLAEAEAVARRLHAGAVSLNDGALTALLSDAAKASFGLSGLGPSRAGEEGLLRFLRRRVLYAQTGDPLPLAAFSEG